MRQKRLRRLIARLPLVPWLWACVVAAVVALAGGEGLLALALVLAGAAPVAFFKGLRYIAVYMGFAPQLLAGYWRYDGRFTPIVEKEFGSGA